MGEVADKKEQDLKELRIRKREQRKRTFIDQKYRNVKSYELKRLNKMINKARKAEGGDQEKIQEIENKIAYVKVIFSL